MDTTGISLFLALTAGAISFLSPCVLPLFPSYLSFITGLSVEDLKEGGRHPTTRGRVLLNSVLFIVGFSTIFIAMGASAGLFGQVLLGNRGVFQKIGGVLIVFFGLVILGMVRIPALSRYLTVPMRTRPAGVLGAPLVGAAFAVGWTPCVGPILGSILALAAVGDTARNGMVMLAAYSAGLGIPFLVSALAFHSFLRLFARWRRLMPVIHTAGGVILVIVGVLLFSGYMTILNSYALSLTPQWLWERL
ncbi:MAG: cytochrome c biogenesis protein CcdA [Deltaproteobacteria bacterium]|nr:cytochrome c biogenesis protein CcdA [Deltaproteobacteria bacterium]